MLRTVPRLILLFAFLIPSLAAAQPTWTPGSEPITGPMRSAYDNVSAGQKMIDVRDLDGIFVKSITEASGVVTIVFQDSSNLEQTLIIRLGDSADGVLTGGAFSADGTMLNLTVTTDGVDSTVAVSVPDLLRQMGGTGTTNLAIGTRTDTTLVVTSSTGTDATLPVATSTEAGLLSGDDFSKLDGIEDNATADQTAAEIKTEYESNADTNAFTDADHAKLDGVEDSATADQTAAEIRDSLQTLTGNDRLNATAIQGIPAGSTDDQTAAEVPVSTTNFDGLLDSDDDSVQDALETLDDITVGGGGNTNLALANRDTDSLEITSSTGTDVEIPSATTTLAGLQSSADKTKLDGIADNATANTGDVTGIDAGDGITVTDGDTATPEVAVTNPFTNADETKLDGIAANAQPGDVTGIDAGTGITVTDGNTATPEVAVTNPFTDADETKLDGIETSATADQTAAEVRDLLESLAGGNRLNANNLRNVPPRYDTGTAFPAGPSGGDLFEFNDDATGLSDAVDYDGTTPVATATRGDVFRYDSGDSEWVKQSASGTGGGGVTNLGIASRDADSLEVTSSTGTNAEIPSATTTLAGLQSSADKTKLDGVEANATADQTAGEIRDSLQTLTGNDRLNATAIQGIPAGGTDDQNAGEVATDTTNFNSHLSATDTTVQAALDTIDDFTFTGATVLSDNDPADVVTGTGDSGTAASVSRSDHSHGGRAAPGTGVLAVSYSGTGTAGSAEGFSRADHRHNLNQADRFNDGDAPQNVTTSMTGSSGDDDTPARRDHVHGGDRDTQRALASNAPPDVVTGSGSVGTSTAVAREDHTHGGDRDTNTQLTLSDADPANIGTTAAAGTSSEASRRDHVHAGTPQPADSVTSLTFGTTGTTGTGDEYAREDHRHGIVNAGLFDNTAPEDVVTGTGSAGTETVAARRDHVHGGAGTGGGATDLGIANRGADSLEITSSTGDDVTLPAASTTEAGLMSSTDKTALNGAITGLSFTAGTQQLTTADVDGTTSGVFLSILREFKGNNPTGQQTFGFGDYVRINDSYYMANAQSTTVTDPVNDIPGHANFRVIAFLDSPALTGDPTAPTPADGDNDTSIATTGFVTPLINALQGLIDGLTTRVEALEGGNPPVQDHTNRAAISTDTTLDAAEYNAGTSSTTGDIAIPTWDSGARYVFLGVPESEGDITNIEQGGIGIFHGFVRVTGVIEGHKWWRTIAAQSTVGSGITYRITQ